MFLQFARIYSSLAELSTKRLYYFMGLQGFRTNSTLRRSIQSDDSGLKELTENYMEFFISLSAPMTSTGSVLPVAFCTVES